MLRTPDSPSTTVTPGEARSRHRDSPPARLVVQRGLFLGPSPLVPEDLYAAVARGGLHRDRVAVHLAPHSRVSTNTYFGRFHATYWQRWTPVAEVVVEAVAAGSGRVRLMASDTNKVARIVAAAQVTAAEREAVRLVGPADRFVDGGGMWLELATVGPVDPAIQVYAFASGLGRDRYTLTTERRSTPGASAAVG